MPSNVRKTIVDLDAFAAAVNVAVKRVGAGATFHFDPGEKSVASANATDLATALTLVNELRDVYEGTGAETWPGHRRDALVHTAADTTNATAAPKAADLATAITLANELKADFNAHRSQAGVHPNNDGTNAVAAADATDLASLLTLLNEIKADLNAHLASAPSGTALLRVVSF